MLKKILQKISWKSRKIILSIDILTLLLHTNYQEWGIDLFRVNYGFKSYSLFKFTFILPNGADRRRVTFELDLFFLRQLLFDHYVYLSDRELWSLRGMSEWENIQYKILKKLFEFNYR